LRGGVEVGRGRWDESIRLLKRATDRDPQNGSVAVELCKALGTAGRYADAETVLDHAFSLTGSDTPLLAKARNCFLSKGDGMLALKMLDEIPVGIRSERYWRARWQLLRDRGDFVGALAAIDHMQGDVIEGAEPKALLQALTLESMGDRAGAGRAFEAALSKAVQLRAGNPRTWVIYLALARVYAGLGRKEEVFSTLRDAMELGNGAAYATAQVNELVAQADARFQMIDEALELAKTQIATGWWKRNDLLLAADWSALRKDPRFKAIAEKAPL
jgi:tetratricopeptide (TPR) repeat protein